MTSKRALPPQTGLLAAVTLTGREAEAPLTGREYLRVSKDKSGKMKSPAQQHDENQPSCARHGITLLDDPYREKRAVSASRFSTDVRDEFERLMEDLRTGQFGADVLVLWENSRGSRRVIEWVTLLDVLEARGILVHVTTHGRTYDPRNARDRRSLIDDANDSEYESAKIAGRIGRDMAASAAQGRPHGLCPYGLRPVYDERTGRLITWEADPGKAEVIKQLFTRLRKGVSFRRITRDFAELGYVNGKGNPFTAPHLRDMAVKAVYTAYRDYRGELIEGTWEPLVDRETWWEVQRILSEPGHQLVKPRPSSVMHAYTRTLRCDECGGPMGVTERNGYTDYYCQEKGCVRIKKAAVDAVLDRVIVAYLSRPDVHRKLSRRIDSAQVRAVRAELAEHRAELLKANNQRTTTVAEALALAQLREDLKIKVDEIEARHRALTIPSELAHFIEPGADVAKRWKEAPVEARRKAAAILLSPPWLGQVRITPAPPKRRAPAAERMTWKRESQAA
ncbi:recombinase family protein [Acrocarpospora sp. B8E8]|uniref:recombinase family protein n=1 Tax=Acrocarpospora sp. B8E8 TaxID=3153572 RepID=UPI00325C3C59